MLPIEIPPGTTATVLVTEIVPELHAKMVPADAPAEAFAVALRIEDEGSWTVRVHGARMTVSHGEEPGVKPTLWMWTTARAVERFLEDATGEKRMLPKFGPVGGVATMSDPRVLKRVAMASGRIELALVDERGERLGIVFGFGAAAKKEMDPEDADTVIEADLATVERVLQGELGPEDALADGNVRVKGNRLLAMQLALAVAPFYPAKR